MSMKFTDLQCKEVICIGSGQRLGFITDVQIDIPEGTICAIVVPGPCRFFGILGREEDYVIPFDCISRIGDDIILAEVQGDYRREKTPKRPFI